MRADGLLYGLANFGSAVGPFAREQTTMGQSTADFAAVVPWNGVMGKPELFPPLPHKHTLAEIERGDAVDRDAIRWSAKHHAFIVAPTYRGLKGIRGAQGFQGYGGTQGAQGPLGPAGDTGNQGAQGYAGNQGPQGAAGPNGDAGEAGADGPQGDAGGTGAQGYTGDAGNQGPQGPQGANGAAGATGPQGDEGDQGEDGAQGPQGMEGMQGPDGPPGAPGVYEDGYSAAETPCSFAGYNDGESAGYTDQYEIFYDYYSSRPCSECSGI